MPVPTSTAASTNRFHESDRAALRRLPRSSHLSHIARILPLRLGAMIDDLALDPGARVLDFGCADAPYRDRLPADGWVGADLPGNPMASVTIAPDGTVPVPDQSFDAVLSTQVLEHVAEPATYLAEARRVLRPGGQLLLSTHGLMFYHPDPVDLWRWTGPGLERAVAASGLRVTRLEGIMGLTATGLQLAHLGLLAHVPVRSRRVVGRVAQSLVARADRLDSDESRRLNACVFAVVAERP